MNPEREEGEAASLAENAAPRLTSERHVGVCAVGLMLLRQLQAALMPLRDGVEWGKREFRLLATQRLRQERSGCYLTV